MLLKKDATKYVEKRNLFGWCGNGKFFRNIESRNVLWSWTRIFRLDLKKPNKFFVVLRIHGKGKFAVLSGRYAHKFTKLPIEIGFVVESAFKGNLLYAFSALKNREKKRAFATLSQAKDWANISFPVSCPKGKTSPHPRVSVLFRCSNISKKISTVPSRIWNSVKFFI